MERFDVVVIGAGAAGMMCAAEAALRGRRVLVLDHARAPGEKIRISGGGRCNFTNLGVHPSRFLSDNPRFCISALSRYTPADFIALLDGAGIAWRERTLGQLFLEGSARQVVDLLVGRMTEAGAELRLSTPVRDFVRLETGFRLTLDAVEVAADRVVLATGGKSIPKMGAT
ncbi:MAG: FAD-dependent oxidoreductase, partial [Phenylobacterium sp.]|nr:FAD-dependent oxidoreductase [Phenylobacterium sp.]